jgi:hypothetical protein
LRGRLALRSREIRNQRMSQYHFNPDTESARGV